MAEITLGDLLVWEPRLRLVAPRPTPTDAASNAVAPGAGSEAGAAAPPVTEREVSWAVGARATAPILPPLRGGEVVLLPHRIVRESGVGFGPLLRELANHDVAAVVMEAETAPPGLRAGSPLPILVLSVGPLTANLESDLNRLLTEQRGELYRAGTEIGRLLSSLTTAGVDAGRIVSATAERLGIPVEVADGNGHRLVVAGKPAPPQTRDPRSPEHHAIPLAGGETLWLGPLPADRRALARLAGERVGVAVEAALARTARVRPRGPARAAALAAFITAGAAEGPDRTATAAALGLVPSARFRVALGSPVIGEGGMQRALAPFGVVHDAAIVDGMAAAVVDLRGEAAATAAPPAPPTTRLPGSVAPSGKPWVALSAPTSGVSGIAGAMRQARFLAGLFAADLIPGPLARFDRLDDLGVYALLYAHWGRSDLRAFAASALGDLPLRDRRGVLRQTLLAYLETGGSHVDAATRLGVHRNTLAYRLKQVAGLTGHDPAHPPNRLVLHLALLATALPPCPDTERNGGPDLAF